MSEEDRPRSPLESERGRTRIKDGVVSKIAGEVAGEVEGIFMGGGASRAAGGVLGSMTGSQSKTQGISAEVGRTETAIDVTMGIEYGGNIQELAERVRREITDRVEDLTGLRVKELNVTVSDVVFPEDYKESQSSVQLTKETAGAEDAPSQEDETAELRLDDEESERHQR